MTDPTRDDDTPGDRADGDEPVDAEIIDVDGESVLDAKKKTKKKKQINKKKNN